MTPLHRHQLALLSEAGWARVQARPWDAAAAACLRHWAAHRLPLVVTRPLQPMPLMLAPAARSPLSRPQAGSDDGPPRDGQSHRDHRDHRGDLGDPGGREGHCSATLSLGLAAPARWQRRRIALAVERGDVAWFDEFPLASRLAPLLSPDSRAAWQRLCDALRALGATARVYGSHGWQWWSGLDHVHAKSDLDLWVAVGTVQVADAVAAELNRFAAPQAPRLDGELVFPDGRAVAWREWQAWRAGRGKAILVKSLGGAALVEAAGFAMGAVAGAAPERVVW